MIEKAFAFSEIRYTRIPEIGSEFGVGGSWILKNGSVHLGLGVVLNIKTRRGGSDW